MKSAITSICGTKNSYPHPRRLAWLGAKQGLLPGNFCIFTDLFKLSFLRAAMFIV